MKRLILSLLALAVFVGAPSQAWAQRQGRGGFGGGAGGLNGVGLLAQKSVQDELKLTPEQVKQVDEQTAKLRESAGDLRNLGREEARAKFQERAKASSAAAAAILKEDQHKRFKQIALQQSGPATFSNPETAESLNLTSEQKDRVKTIQEGVQSEQRSLFQAAGTGGDREELRKKTAEVRKAAFEKLQGVLTPEQQTKWKELSGEPFKGEIQRPQRGNRAGAGARRSARSNSPAQANASDAAVTRNFFQLASFKADDKDDDRPADAKKSDRPKHSKKHAHRHRHGKPSRAVGKGPGGSHAGRDVGHVAHGPRWHGRHPGPRGPDFARRHHPGQGHRHPGHGPQFARHHGHPGHRSNWADPRHGHGPRELFARHDHRRGPGPGAWEHARHHGPPRDFSSHPPHHGHPGHHHFAGWHGHRGPGPGPGHFEGRHFEGHRGEGFRHEGGRHEGGRHEGGRHEGHGRPHPHGDRDRWRSDLNDSDEHVAGGNETWGRVPQRHTSDASDGDNSERISQLQQSLDLLARQLRDLEHELRR